MSANIEFIITEIFPIVDASVSNRWNILNEGMVLNNNEANLILKLLSLSC